MAKRTTAVSPPSPDNASRASSARPRQRRTDTRRAQARVADKRRDESGKTWTQARMEGEIATLVARLTPGCSAVDLSRATRFRDHLGWDEWSLLRLVKPVLRQFHETLSDFLVKDLKTVGDLMDYVWSKMEDVS